MTPKKATKKKRKVGRPALGKVKLTCYVTPKTRKAIGPKPGEVLDAYFGGSNKEISDNG